MHAAIEKLWKLVPSPVQDLIASALDVFHGVTIPRPPVVPQSVPIRVFIGPANYAGQAYRWGRAAAQNPNIITRCMVSAGNNAFDYPVDYTVRWRTMAHSRRWQRELLETLRTNYTHVMIEAEAPVLGGMFASNLGRQVEAMRSAGLKVAMIVHGTDARLPSRHRELEQWSPYADDSWAPLHVLEATALNNLEMLERIAAPTFVSTAGLLLDLPKAYVLPVVIEPARWQSNEAVLLRPRPRLVHVPSNPLLKGTLHIDPMLNRLHDEGVIEYVRVFGSAHADMPSLIRSADIVLDQFRLGEYGVAACESMAAGRLVVSHVSDQVRTYAEAQAALELPIVEATIDTLEVVLRDVLDRREHYREIAARGPAFVRHSHDGRLAREVLEQHFLIG